MNRILKDKRIVLYGSFKDVDFAEKTIYDSPEYNQLDENYDENTYREVLQKIIDDNKLKADILFNGNRVWSKNKIIRNIKTIIKHNDMNKMNKYLYHFLSLSCGSIAHFDKYGWIQNYPTVEHLKQFFVKNEFGERVLWFIGKGSRGVFDSFAIALEIEKLFGINPQN